MNASVVAARAFARKEIWASVSRPLQMPIPGAIGKSIGHEPVSGKLTSPFIELLRSWLGTSHMFVFLRYAKF
jgi:hypothetical protein